MIEELARESGLAWSTLIKLASNENPRGMSPLARDAASSALDDSGRYPDPGGYRLKEALGRRLMLPIDWFTLGRGSTEVFEITARAFLETGSGGMFSQYSFAGYPWAILSAGGRPIAVPARSFGHDLEAMLAALTCEIDLVFVGNPNNPTGTLLPYPAIKRFIEKVPSSIIVVLDEAYREYLPDHLTADVVGWVREHHNLVVTRTFSKAYGLAGLRVGYGIAQPATTAKLNRVRVPHNVNVVAQAAAIGALDDSSFVVESARLNREGLSTLSTGLERLGITYIPSHGNFLLFRVGNATVVERALLARGIMVRSVASYELPEWLRVSVGLPNENSAFLAALSEILTPIEQAR